MSVLSALRADLPPSSLLLDADADTGVAPPPTEATRRVWNTNPVPRNFANFSGFDEQVLRLAFAELAVSIGKPTRHPDLLTVTVSGELMTVSGEEERLRVAVAGCGRVLDRGSTSYFPLTRQQGTDQRTRSVRPKHVTCRARSNYQRPPEPTPE